jgi:excisionase family DNA binding protein
VALRIAVKAITGLSVRTARQLIKAGKLPAAKIGRDYFIRPEDLRRIFEPTVRQAAEKPQRESATARIARQLAAAGVGGAQ